MTSKSENSNQDISKSIKSKLLKVYISFRWI